MDRADSKMWKEKHGTNISSFDFRSTRQLFVSYSLLEQDFLQTGCPSRRRNSGIKAL